MDTNRPSVRPLTSLTDASTAGPTRPTPSHFNAGRRKQLEVAKPPVPLPTLSPSSSIAHYNANAIQCKNKASVTVTLIIRHGTGDGTQQKRRHKNRRTSTRDNQLRAGTRPVPTNQSPAAMPAMARAYTVLSLGLVCKRRRRLRRGCWLRQKSQEV